MTDATNDGTLKDATIEESVEQKQLGLRQELAELFQQRGIEGGAELLARFDEILAHRAPKAEKPERIKKH